MKTLIEWDAIGKRLTAVCDQYEKTAPTVHAWADDLYVRMTEDVYSVSVAEINLLDWLYDVQTGVWMQANYAANGLYKLLHRMGRDTTGMAGY